MSVRIEEELKQQIEDLGYRPGEFIKQMLDREVKKAQSRRALEWIKDNRVPGGSKNTEDMIRRDRDMR